MESELCMTLLAEGRGGLMAEGSPGKVVAKFLQFSRPLMS